MSRPSDRNLFFLLAGLFSVSFVVTLHSELSRVRATGGTLPAVASLSTDALAPMAQTTDIAVTPGTPPGTAGTETATVINPSPQPVVTQARVFDPEMAAIEQVQRAEQLQDLRQFTDGATAHDQRVLAVARLRDLAATNDPDGAAMAMISRLIADADQDVAARASAAYAELQQRTPNVP